MFEFLNKKTESKTEMFLQNLIVFGFLGLAIFIGGYNG